MSFLARYEALQQKLETAVDQALESEVAETVKVIMEEKGKFDIKHTSRSLQYVDQHNRKHNIYFGDNSTVTVDELK